MSESILKEQLAIAIHGLRRCNYSYGGFVLVTSGNLQGIAIALAAKHYGSAQVIVVCQNEQEQADAKDMGLECVMPVEVDPTQLAAITDGRGFDYAFETSGSAAGYGIILEQIKRGGVVGIFNHLDQPYTFFVKTAIRSQIRFIGIHSAQRRDEDEAERLWGETRERKHILEQHRREDKIVWGR